MLDRLTYFHVRVNGTDSGKAGFWRQSYLLLMIGKTNLNALCQKKKVERIRRMPSHGVAALSDFGIEQGHPFRVCIDSS